MSIFDISLNPTCEMYVTAAIQGNVIRYATELKITDVSMAFVAAFEAGYFSLFLNLTQFSQSCELEAY
jgi:hypothetical protein